MKKIFIAFAVLCTMAVSAPALTFDDLAGTYVGKRTETYPDHVNRYDEVDIIDTTGYIQNYVYQDGVLIYFSVGTLVIDDDGNFMLDDAAQGQFVLNGHHVDLTVDWYGLNPAVVVEIKAHRTEKNPF